MAEDGGEEAEEAGEGADSKPSSPCVLSSELFSTPAREIKVTGAGAASKSYFVQESVLASIPYFKAQLKRWTTRGPFELKLPQDALHSSFTHILMRLLSPQTPPWDSIRWCGAVQQDLPEALGTMVLSKMLLVDWISAELSGAVHLLAGSRASCQLVRDVAQRAGLTELAPFGADGGSMPLMNGEEMRAMLCSAANGHQAGRDFARDVVLWRHARGHGSEDAMLLLDVLKSAGQIVNTWDDADYDFPVKVFAWLWELISQCVLPTPESFRPLVEAFSPLSSLRDRSCKQHRRCRRSCSAARQADDQQLDPGSCLQIKEAFKQLLYVGLRFHQIEAVAEDDLHAAFNIGLSCGTKLLSFSGIHQAMPAFLPTLVSDWIPALRGSMGNWIIAKLREALQEKIWDLFTPAVLAAFDAELQMECVLTAPTSFFDLAKLEALREGPWEKARCRLATVAGELEQEMLDFLRGRRGTKPRASEPCIQAQVKEELEIARSKRRRCQNDEE